MGSHSSGFEMLGQLSAPCPHPACLVTGSPCVLVALSTTIMFLRCQTFTEMFSYILGSEKETDTEEPCLQEGIQLVTAVSCVRLGGRAGLSGSRCWTGKGSPQGPEREGRGRVAGEFLGLEGLAAAWCRALSSRQTHGPPGCLPSLVCTKARWESIFVHEIHHTFLWASIVKGVWVVYIDAFPAHHKLCT